MNDKDQRPARPTRAAPRNYFSRREQFRLLLMVGALVLVLNLAWRAGDPESWQWLTNLDQQPGEVTQDVPRRAADAPIDNRLPRRVAPGAPVVEGEFRLAAEPRPARPSPFTMNRAALEGGPDSETQIWGDVAAIAEIQDNTPFRSREHDAWKSVIERLEQAAPAEVAETRSQRVQYAQLHQQADSYRGKLVTVRGIVRRANHVPSTDPEFRPDGFWRLWLFPTSSDSPIVIYALDLPAEFPQGDSVYVDLTVTGVFFKRWVYPAEGGPMTAPLVIAKSIQWQPPPVDATAVSFTNLLLGLGLVLALSLTVARLIWWGNRDGPSSAEQRILARKQRQFEQEASQISPGPGPREQLAQLAERLQGKQSENRPTHHEADDEDR
ncbi:MAG: hypothetical protein WDZ51_01010 [Pirellulaceae bacterium]